MSGRRTGGKPSPEYNIVLLGDLGVGKSGELLNFIFINYFMAVLILMVLFFEHVDFCLQYVEIIGLQEVKES